MIIAGLQKLTLLDYPQHLAATVFTRGCNMRCPYCYNVDLVLPGENAASAPDIDALGFLRGRKGLLDGVCITGGEPTLQPDLPEFCASVHELGLNVKLDTNGTRPDVVARLIEDGLVDYIAMDIKNAFDAYPATAGLVAPFASEERAHELIENIRTSMNLISQSGIEFEFRTTVAQETHSLENLLEIARTVADVVERTAAQREANRAAMVESNAAPNDGASSNEEPLFKGWFLQRFDEHAPATVGASMLHAWTSEQLEQALEPLREVLPQTYLRGTD